MPLHGLAVFKADAEILDQLAFPAQRHAGHHQAFRLSLHRGNKAFLRGDVRIKEDLLQAGVPAALEFRFRDHAHRKVRSVSGGIVQFLNAQAVKVFAAGSQIRVVILPGLHRIIGYPAGEKDRFPHLFDGLVCCQAREHLLRPIRAGHSCNTPLVLVVHFIPVAFDQRIAHLLCLEHFILVNTLQAVRIIGIQVDPAGQFLHIVFPAGFLVVRQAAQGFHVTVFHMDLLQGRVVKIHHDPAGSQLVAFLHQHLHEFRLVQPRVDKDFLSLLHVRAAFSDQPGIFPQYGFLHGCFSSFLMSLPVSGHRVLYHKC